MKTIQKHFINVAEKSQVLNLKKGYRVVRSEYNPNNSTVNIWVEIPLMADIPNLKREFIVKRTNEVVPNDYTYVSTTVDKARGQSYHIFEAPALEAEKYAEWAA
ncbi:hypothetical protein [uncultured Amphritea sp.]|uniref:DUF7352 domain-containing protein n=1 Tax=uncultured Amphritea sp. TaxID=981605 RepID=UPI002635381F|nr:hypothetical protein [uncultured Amphritea sp.]